MIKTTALTMAGLALALSFTPAFGANKKIAKAKAIPMINEQGGISNTRLMGTLTQDLNINDNNYGTLSGVLVDLYGCQHQVTMNTSPGVTTNDQEFGGQIQYLDTKCNPLPSNPSPENVAFTTNGSVSSTASNGGYDHPNDCVMTFDSGQWQIHQDPNDPSQWIVIILGFSNGITANDQCNQND